MEVIGIPLILWNRGQGGEGKGNSHKITWETIYSVHHMSDYFHFKMKWWSNQTIFNPLNYRNLWIPVSPVSPNPPPPILTYICSATSANCVRMQSDAPNRFVSTTAAFWYMTLQPNSSVIDASVLVFVRKKDYIFVNRAPLFLYLYERRKFFEEHGTSVVNSS